jgi:tetratricopeptide (TPR) repeat protein
MILSKTTRSYSGSKDNMIPRLFLLFILIIYTWNCVGTSYQKMARDDPAALIALEDSLSERGPSPSVISALVAAHNILGIAALESEDYKKGIDHFSKAVGLSELDTLSRYNLLIAEGHLLYKRGNKDGLWDAIQNYYKAAQLKPDLGDPHYYIGQSYHKIGDTDFDLILESYEKALTLNLSSHIREKTKAAHARAAQRDKLLKDFWK